MSTLAVAVIATAQCRCHQCMARSETLDVMAALQEQAERDRQHVQLVTSENHRLNQECLRLARHIDLYREQAEEHDRIDAHDWVWRDGRRQIDQRTKRRTVSAIVCAACFAAGAVWWAWMGRGI